LPTFQLLKFTAGPATGTRAIPFCHYDTRTPASKRHPRDHLRIEESPPPSFSISQTPAALRAEYLPTTAWLETESTMLGDLLGSGHV